MIKPRPYDKTYYGILAGWWKGHPGWEPLPEDFIPKHGVVCVDEGTSVCAAFLYETDTKLAWIGFPIVDPTVSKEVRKDALDALIPSLLGIAKNLGYAAVMTTLSAGYALMTERFLAAGFLLTDENVAQYLWREP